MFWKGFQEKAGKNSPAAMKKFPAEAAFESVSVMALNPEVQGH
jgi:hypothetical protein